MKVIIAGSRGFTDYEKVLKSIQEVQTSTGLKITEVVSGTARGVDQLGERFAIESGIAIKRFPAKWKTYGKRAGYVRNVDMAEYADVLIAIWDGRSKGTKHMIDIAKKQKIPIHYASYYSEGSFANELNYMLIPKPLF